jgi:hypothetical protein
MKSSAMNVGGVRNRADRINPKHNFNSEGAGNTSRLFVCGHLGGRRVGGPSGGRTERSGGEGARRGLDRAAPVGGSVRFAR